MQTHEVPQTCNAPLSPQPGKFSWHRLSGLLLVGFGTLGVIASLLLGSARAQAILHDIAETGTPGYLMLRANETATTWQTLTTGASSYWLIESALHDADEAQLTLEMRADGTLTTSGRLWVQVESCTTPYLGDGETTRPTCPGAGTTIVTEQPLTNIAAATSGKLFTLADLTQISPRYLLVALTLHDGDQGGDTSVGVGLHASGDTTSPAQSNPEELSLTGTDLTVLGLLATGLAAVIAGAWMLRHGARPAGGERP